MGNSTYSFTHLFIYLSFSQQILIKGPPKVRKMKRQTLSRNQLKGSYSPFSKEDIEMANKAHEKMLNITTHQGSANQNHNAIPPQTHQDGYYQNKQTKNTENTKCSRGCGEIGTLVHCWQKCKTVKSLENIMSVPQKIKHRITI